MKNIELLSFSAADELARAAAAAWLDEIAAANREGRAHTVALSGGRITQKFFASAVAQNESRRISFANVHFFWADERCVPPTNPDSNFKMADELLFTPLKISAEKIHPLRGELPPAKAVELATVELLQFTSSPAAQNALPKLDLIFLGMGEDGHIASLFPNASANILDSSAPFLVVDDSPKPPPTRISLSFAAIAAARQVWALVSGPGKEAAFRESLKPAGKTPLGRVISSRPVKIFSDLPPTGL